MLAKKTTVALSSCRQTVVVGGGACGGDAHREHRPSSAEDASPNAADTALAPTRFSLWTTRLLLLERRVSASERRVSS